MRPRPLPFATWRAAAPGPISRAAAAPGWIHAKAVVEVMVRLGLFLLVEGVAEAARRHLHRAGAPLLSSSAGASLATASWAYAAHRRFAFRSSTAAGRSSLLGLPPFLAVSCLIAVSHRLAGMAGLTASLATWGVGCLVKYWIVRRIIWPAGWDGRATCARP